MKAVQASVGPFCLWCNRLVREALSVVKLVCRISVRKMVSLIIVHSLREAEEEGKQARPMTQSTLLID